MTHMVAATAEADEQVGRIMAALDAEGDLKDTLVVLTADHGSVSGVNFHGELVDARDSGFDNWYFGTPLNDRVYSSPPDDLAPLTEGGNVGLSYSDSMLSVWLTDQSPEAVAVAAGTMAGLADVTAVWRRDGDHFTLVSPVRWDLMTTKAERQWFSKYAQELIDTQAAAYGPDLIGTLPDDTTYSVAGDHGGIQRATQVIPIVFAGAGLSDKDVKAPVRSVDIMPTILKAMGIEPIATMDGVAYPLPLAKKR
jgi:arylsulfatase A-like enzyme